MPSPADKRHIPAVQHNFLIKIPPSVLDTLYEKKEVFDTYLIFYTVAVTLSPKGVINDGSE